jgi:L,D-peptidoglycan transpeptidase YkuD (ErfK/YbiS/YcfS/YnhG family)
MSVGRIVSTSVAVVTVAGCAVVVVGMARATTNAEQPVAADRIVTSAVAEPSASIPAQLPAAPVARPKAPRTHHAITAHPATAAAAAVAAPTTSVTPTPTVSAPTTHPVVRAVPATPSPTRTTTTATHRVVPRPAATPTRAPAHTTTPRGVALPVRGYTGSATRVITVKAGSTSSTVATLQAWNKAPGGGWLRYGRPTTAHVGADGLSRSPSEYRSATPIGSFTLTQAFGYYGNPGTHLRYFKTTGADWWISQSGPLYNTHQHCWSNCAFRRGDPNEHLMYETPYYNYAVVIDYNTRNSPTGVRQGAGSAFFLHVSVGQPTAGCVSIPQANLVTIMRWLTPTAHPRILIGTS